MWCRERFKSGADAEAGSALVAVLLGAAFLSALAASAILLSTSDTLGAARQRDARVALYAAEAALEQAAAELVRAADWNAVLSGAAVSPRAGGLPSDSRIPFADGEMTAAQVANLATCAMTTACTAEASAAVTDDRPWGANNPWWRPYFFGAVDEATPAQAATYVVVLVGDDPSENDGDPSRDGVAPGNPGADVLLLRAEAFGPGGTRRAVEAVVARVGAAGAALPRVISWRAVR